jgi:hypothetical protein
LHYNNAFTGYIWGMPWNWIMRKEVKGFNTAWGEAMSFAETWLDK